MRELILVAIGSMVGGSGRWLVTQATSHLWGAPTAVGTLTVNVLGSFIMGILLALPWGERWCNPQLRLLLATGLCGGFTTFSSMMADSHTLLSSGRIGALVAYGAASLTLGFIALCAGIGVGHLIGKWMG